MMFGGLFLILCILPFNAPIQVESVNVVFSPSPVSVLVGETVEVGVNVTNTGGPLTGAFDLSVGMSLIPVESEGRAMINGETEVFALFVRIIELHDSYAFTIEVEGVNPGVCEWIAAISYLVPSGGSLNSFNETLSIEVQSPAPPIPGFPWVAIIIGFVLAIVLVTRFRKSSTKPAGFAAQFLQGI